MPPRPLSADKKHAQFLARAQAARALGCASYTEGGITVTFAAGSPPLGPPAPLPDDLTTDDEPERLEVLDDPMTFGQNPTATVPRRKKPEESA